MAYQNCQIYFLWSLKHNLNLNLKLLFYSYRNKTVYKNSVNTKFNPVQFLKITTSKHYKSCNQ
jgi:hypothetical protein